MNRSRSAMMAFLIVALLTGTGSRYPTLHVHAEGAGATGTQLYTAISEMQLTLSAAHKTSSWDDRDPERLKFDLPLLTLRHEREATLQADRTLVVGLAGLEAGSEIEIEVLSRHVHPVTEKRHRETISFVADRPCTADQPCLVRWTFDPATMLSDFYTLRIRDDAGDVVWQNPHPDRPDFVLLDTWDVGIDAYTVRITYATLFPFAMGAYDLDNRLDPGAVTDFVEHRLVPIVVDTWHTQFHVWGFGPIHPAWDADGVVEVIVTDPPFALLGGTGTYTRSVYPDGRPYPERRIWWYAGNNSLQAYDTLENGYKAVFAHEFFHLVQWNVLLSAGCSTHKWRNVFIEAQGKFVPSVQYPELELFRGHVVSLNSEYVAAANGFLTQRLNSSYRTLEEEGTDKYDAALYWRFLYEQLGGMGIIRAALEEMACQYDPDIERSLGKVMDAALARSDGPFQTFEESLLAFSQANFALRLANGRCTRADRGGCEGKYFDPHYVYVAPPLEATLEYSGSRLVYDGSIPARFGMDFIEVGLDGDLRDQPIRLGFEGKGARFSIQIWHLSGGSADREDLTQVSTEQSGGMKPRALTPHPEVTLENDGSVGTNVILDLAEVQCDRIGLILTRLDANEGPDPTVGYVIRLETA